MIYKKGGVVVSMVVFLFLFLSSVMVFAMLVPLPIKTADTSTISTLPNCNRIISNERQISHVTKLNLPESAHQAYVKRMTERQPKDNDRLLPGGGKNHALEAMVSATSLEQIDEITVLQQIGDVFS